MTLRIAAALSLVLGVAALLAYLHLLGKGPFADPAARHMRAMKDRITAPASCETITFAGMEHLPRGRPVAEYAAVERRGAVLEAYVQHVLHAPDGDFHLSLAPLPPHREGPYYRSAIAEITPQWHRHSKTWRYERLTELFRPAFGDVTPWEGGARRVRLSGWLMYDYPHEGFVPKDPHLLPAVSAWEIHPVTRIEFWDDSLGAFVEYPR